MGSEEGERSSVLSRVLYALVRATSACRVVSCRVQAVFVARCVLYSSIRQPTTTKKTESTTDPKNEDIGREDAKAKSASPTETLFVRLPYPFGILSFSSILGRG